MDKNTPVKVLNRDNGNVVYSIPEMNGLRRVFHSGEIKEITFEEIEKLSYLPGGLQLLKDCLVIMDNPTIVENILGHVEPQYSYTEKDVIKLMKQGSLDEFLDCLDFAPAGVIDLIKSLAVKLPLNDVSKREAILNKTGFNVDNAIRIKKESEDPVENHPTAERRVKKVQTQNETGGARRVVTKKE